MASKSARQLGGPPKTWFLPQLTGSKPRAQGSRTPPHLQRTRTPLSFRPEWQGEGGLTRVVRKARSGTWPAGLPLGTRIGPRTLAPGPRPCFPSALCTAVLILSAAATGILPDHGDIQGFHMSREDLV